VRARLRAYAGLWILLALLGAVLVFVAAAAGPANRHVTDQALRQSIAQAPTSARDLTVSEPAGAYDTTARELHDQVRRLLPPELDDVTEVGWGIQRTQARTPGTRPQWSASLAGDGIDDQPYGFLPLATLHHQTGLAGEIRVVDGTEPATEPGGRVVRVMASAEVAGAFGMRVGQAYQLLLGVAPLAPERVAESEAPRLLIELTGVFEPRDPAAPVWEFDRRLLRPAPRLWPLFDSYVPLPMATFVTDQAGIDAVAELGLTELVGTESVARVRLDNGRLDAGWVPGARDAARALFVDPGLRPEMRVQTRLPELLDEFQRQAAAAGAVMAVVAAGLVGTGVGLLVLAARVAVDRRRAELSLLRARGGSRSTVVAWVAREALVVMLPAVTAGWLLHWLVPGRADPGVVLGIGAVPLAVAAVAVLVVPATVGLGRVGYPRPVRVTVELLVLLLAALGVLLLSQRGLQRAGADPYLSAVPVLLGVAAGLLALRCYPWPLRVLGAVASRRRGVVGFLGLARAGRAAPAAALPLVVLVLAVAVGGFAGAVYASVAAARDAAAVRAVGADARVAGEVDSVAAVAAVPGVTAVAGASYDAFIRAGRGVDQNAGVAIVDAAAYQDVLASIGAPGRLPDRIVSARPDSGPIPILGPPGDDLRLLIDGEEYPAERVGGVTDLPALRTNRSWVFVPRQAVPVPVPVEELLVAGPDADLAAVAATAGDPDATVTSLAVERAELERSGFNRALTQVFVAGTAGAALGGLLAIGLALVVEAAARGRALSLLRTMGLSSRQARALLLVELVPVATLAVAAGAALGTAMPIMLAPALGLTEFAGGAPIPFGLDPRTVAVLGGLLAGFVAGGVVVEAAVNRRLGLGRF
jgi:putative ABC transport system permease protein